MGQSSTCTEDPFPVPTQVPNPELVVLLVQLLHQVRLFCCCLLHLPLPLALNKDMCFLAMSCTFFAIHMNISNCTYGLLSLGLGVPCLPSLISLQKCPKAPVLPSRGSYGKWQQNIMSQEEKKGEGWCFRRQFFCYA